MLTARQERRGMQQESLLCGAEVCLAGLASLCGSFPREKRINRERKRLLGNGRIWPVAQGYLHPSLKRAG